MREDKVKIKLNPIVETVKDKRVILVDDSIVRGTTCVRVAKLLRDAGAKEIHIRSSAPEFLNPCYYGTDVPNRDMLIANQHTKEEIREMIGVDSLNYLDLEDMKKIATLGGKNGFCYACFEGKYATEIPTPSVNI